VIDPSGRESATRAMTLAAVQPPDRAPASPAAKHGADPLARVRVRLDRALVAAFVYASPGAVPPLTPIRWVYRLAGLYHLTRATPALLDLAADKFAAGGRRVLADWARVRAREESHHDLLALRDLRDLGYEPERVVAAIHPAPAIRMVEYFARCVHAPDPIGCVGYAYAVERLAMTVGEADIRAIEAILPPGVRATRCLRVHSAVGSDGDHVADTVAAVAALGPAEQARIAAAAHEAARICFTPDPAGPPSDREIAAMLAIVNLSHKSDNA
jgi:hypothetical protein